MTEKYKEINGLVNVKDNNIHKEVEFKYCRKCLSPLLDGGTNDGFCDRSCRAEYFATERKLSEEVYFGMRNGD